MFLTFVNFRFPWWFGTLSAGILTFVCVWLVIYHEEKNSMNMIIFLITLFAFAFHRKCSCWRRYMYNAGHSWKFLVFVVQMAILFVDICSPWWSLFHNHYIFNTIFSNASSAFSWLSTTSLSTVKSSSCTKSSKAAN
jgi:hypothetical protein